MKKTIMLSVLVSILFIASIAMASAEVTIEKDNGGNSGSIWTTTNQCGAEQQDVNQYSPGEHVYINGANFDEGEYDWDITGQPGQASCDPNTKVASGSIAVDSSRAFCFEAYTVANNDCGVYKVTFGRNKHDNYHVIPEFGLFVGALTLVSAIGVFFLVRRK